MQGTVFSYRFIERNQSEVIEKILRHCNLWIETPPRAPSIEVLAPQPVPEHTVDYDFFTALAS